MANVLKMTKIEAIQLLRSEGMSFRAIAKRLGINRETVSRRLRLAGLPISKPASAPIFPAGTEGPVAGFGAPLGSCVAGFEPPTGPSSSQTSPASPWLAWLLEQRAKGLSAKRIHQDLLVEFPAAKAVSYDSVRRLLKKKGAHKPVPFRRMESPPGYEAQVDFGTGAPVVGPDGKRRRTHVLRVVLSHSRRGYSEAVFTQSTDDFIRCIENAFEHFGGVPRTLVLDNLKAGVLKADWYDPDLNPKFADFCRHYGTVALPTKPRTPRHKGKVSSDGHIEVAKAFYSVPPEYLGRFVWARWNGHLVRILNDRMESIAVHPQQVPGRFQTAYEHVAATKISGLERGITWLLGKARSIGPQA